MFHPEVKQLRIKKHSYYCHHDKQSFRLMVLRGRFGSEVCISHFAVIQSMIIEGALPACYRNQSCMK